MSERTTENVHVRVSKEIMRRVRAIADTERRPLVTQIEILLEAGIEKQEAGQR